MQGITKAISLLIFFLALSVPKWIQAQGDLKSHNGTVQQSLQSLLTEASASKPFAIAAPSTRPADTTPVSTHEKFATFLAGEDFKSVLLLENFRPDLPITFTPALILGAGEIPLDPVTVPAHSTATIDISAALKDRGYAD